MKLVSYEHGEERSFPLREGSTIIGRHPSCHVVIPGRKVSKRHLQCHVENGVVTIRDLDSSNGTTVNGEPVSTRVLEDGDQVSLGGCQLVFDAEAGPAGGEAAAAGFDFEPVAQPGHPPPGPEEAESTQPPGEPSSQQAQAEPLYDESAVSEDDTPADGEFVPQAYSPDSLQPQVVARDGRMFLRNPQTNQEVEIVPRREGGPADLSGYYAEKEAADKRKNMLLIGAAIGVGLLLIVALALTSGTSDTGPPRGTQRKFGRSGYNKRVDRSIDLMKDGDFPKALALLEEAEDVYPNSQIAGVLHQIGKKWRESGKPLDEFDWREVRPQIRQLLESPWRTPVVQAFAADRRAWIENTDHYERVARDARQRLEGNQPEEALKRLAEIPEDSVVYAQTAELRSRVRSACFEMHVSAGESARRSQDWERAIREFEAARKYADNSDDLINVQAGIGLTNEQRAKAREEARRRKEQEARRQAQMAILAEANRLYRQDTVSALERALKVLDRLPEDCLVVDKRDELRLRINSRRAELRKNKKVATARSHYQSGEGEEAIKLITDEKIVQLYWLRTKIRKLERRLEEARTALEAKKYNEAQSTWIEVTKAEPDTDNAYHKQAAGGLRKLQDKAKEIARHYEQFAEEALLKENFAAARRHAMDAMRWDPQATIGKSLLRQLDHLAMVLYKEAVDLRYHSGTTESLRKAVEKFEKVQQCVQEGNKLHSRAGRHLAELRDKVPDA